MRAADPAASDDALTGDDLMTDEVDTEKRESKVLVGQSASVSTGDDSDPAFWFTPLTAALACIATMLALHRNRCRVTGSAADRENHDDRS